jgi:hypothetical protein
MKRVSRRLLLVPECFFAHERRGLLTSFGATHLSANFTRFYVLARSIDLQLPSLRDSWPCSDSPNKGLLRIREQKNHVLSSPGAYDRTREVNLTNLLSALDLQICRLDRRPLPGAKTFSHVYIVEVDDSIQSSSSANSSPIIPDSVVVDDDLERCGGDVTNLQSNRPFVSLESDGGWASRLREAVDRVVEAGGHAEVIGCWL